MGKTADLAMIQKTNVDTLHKEGKSPKVITFFFFFFLACQ